MHRGRPEMEKDQLHPTDLDSHESGRQARDQTESTQSATGEPQHQTESRHGSPHRGDPSHQDHDWPASMMQNAPTAQSSGHESISQEQPNEEAGQIKELSGLSRDQAHHQQADVLLEQQPEEEQLAPPPTQHHTGDSSSRAHEPTENAATAPYIPAPGPLAEEQDLEADEFEADSAIGTDTESLTTSIAESMYNYRMEYGRTYHAYKDGKYIFPNDEREADRLDLQHHLLTRTFGNRLYFAPLHEPRHCLDVGTGTGIWAMEFADEFPNCEVIGIDLSPGQPSMVPPNLRFILDDAEDQWLYDAPFDYIHARLMAGCFADWKNFLRQAYQNLEPGGWLELQDYGLPVKSADGTADGTHLYQWRAALRGGAQARPAYGLGRQRKVRRMDARGWLRRHRAAHVHVAQQQLAQGSLHERAGSLEPGQHPRGPGRLLSRAADARARMDQGGGGRLHRKGIAGPARPPHPCLLSDAGHLRPQAAARLDPRLLGKHAILPAAAIGTTPRLMRARALHKAAVARDRRISWKKQNEIVASIDTVARVQ